MWKKYRALLRKFINYISNSIRIRKKPTDTELARSKATTTRDDQQKLTLYSEEDLLIDKEKNLEKTNIADNVDVGNEVSIDSPVLEHDQQSERDDEIIDNGQNTKVEDQLEILLPEGDDRSDSFEIELIDIMEDVQEEVELSDEHETPGNEGETIRDEELFGLPEVDHQPQTRESAPTSQTMRSRKKFKYDLSEIPILPNVELQKIIKAAQEGSLENEFVNDINNLEIFLLNAFYQYEFIGELPLSKNNFIYICNLIQNRFTRFNRLRVNHVPPALYVTSMVFCARYSEEDARNFWTPYAKLVWNTTSGQYFQNKCRDHFIDSKLFLIERFEFDFPTISRGGVVRPVYYQAIIPYYLQSHFADWLVDQFEQILQYSIDELPDVLRSERSLNYIPPRLRRFVQGADTADAAAKLIQQMAKAARLFQETEQYETVASVMDSPIEKALWKEIYDELIERELSITKIRKFAPTLNWVYDCENEELFLRLAQLRSEKKEKPNLIIWAEKGIQNLKNEDVLIKINPWEFIGGDWKLDPTNINAKGDLDGKLYVLSDEFDLEKDLNEQKDHVIFENEIPKFDADVIYFFLSSKRTDARIKESIDFEGEWIVFSRYKFDFTNEEGVPQEFQAVQIPEILRKNSYIVGRRYTLSLPTTIIYGEIKTPFTKSVKANVINADIIGKDCIPGLSDIVQPIFSSSNIKIHLHAHILIRLFQRVWVSIYRGGKFIESISFAELEQKGLLQKGEDKFTIDLNSYLSQPGLYTLNILHNLKYLLEENLEFGYLPQIIIKGPDPVICYSPVNPLEISISGIDKSSISIIEHEFVKLIEDQDQIKIIWKRLKEDTCRFTLQWEGNVIHFAWDINRVAAWIEGGGDQNTVKAGQEEDIKLQVRADSKEDFNWVIQDSGKHRKTTLDSNGKYEKLLSHSVLRDMLKESNKVQAYIDVNIRDLSWNVFSYLKFPKIRIVKVKYVDSLLSMIIQQEEELEGKYKVEIKDKSNPIDSITLDETNILVTRKDYKIELQVGTYFVEISLDGERLAVSEDIKITEAIAKKIIIEDQDIFIYNDEEDYDQRVFRCVTADYHSLIKKHDHGDRELISILRQIILINTQETWITDEKLDDGLKVLLPSWAVLQHPLTFHSKEHNRIFHIYPQEVVYGAQSGKGYMTATFEQESIKLYAAWNTDFAKNRTNLWLMVPQIENIRNFCELDEHDLWPAYQCLDCGIIVGSKEGTFIRLSPLITVLHKHTKNRSVKDQFIDTVYKQHIEVNLSQYENKKLSHCYKPKEVVGENIFDNMLDGKLKSIIGELNLPIDTGTNRDLQLSISEVINNYQKQSQKIILQQIISNEENLLQIKKYMGEDCEKQPAFSAALRLLQALNAHQRISRLPLQILLLAMVLRLKPIDPEMYQNLLLRCNLSEQTLSQLSLQSMKACPKLLEWSIAWAEIFYTHSIS